MTILQFSRHAVRVAANQDGDNIVPQGSSSRDMRQVADADEIQQTESRDHERIGILARRYSGFLDTDWI